MEEKITFSVKVTVKDLYFFLLRHLFTGFGGWFGILFAAGLVALAVFTKGKVTVEYTVIYLVIALFVLVYPFFNLYGKAKKQVSSERLNRPLQYRVGEEGITVALEEEEAGFAWQDLKKIVETKKLLIVYVNAVRAFLWPKEQIGSQYHMLRNLLEQKLQASQNHLKKS